MVTAEPRSFEDLAAAARQSFLERYDDRGRSLAKEFKKRKLTPGYRKHVDAWLEFLERARKAYQTERVAEGGLDANVEAAAAALHHDLDAYVPYWIASMGGDFAVRAFCRMWAIDWFGIERASYINDNDQHPEYPVARSNARCWASLRRGIESLDGVALRKTRDEAARIREKAPLALRCALDFAFPNEAAWAEEDIEAMLAAREPYFDYLFLNEGQFAAALLATRARAEARAKMVAQLAKWGARAVGGAMFCVPFVTAMHGEEAIASLAALMNKASPDDKKKYAEALAMMPPSKEAARSLAEGLEDKSMRAAAQDYLTRHAEVAQPVLEELVARHAKVSEAAKRLLDRLGGGARTPIAVAAASELPPALARPPWESGKPRPELPVVTGLKERAYKETIAWAKGEKEAASKPVVEVELLIGWREMPAKTKPRSKEMNEFVAKKLKAAKNGEDWFKRLHFAATYMHVMTDAAALEAWNHASPNAWDADTDDARYALARFGTEAIPGLLALGEVWPQKALVAAANVDSPRLAPLMADALVRMKKAGPLARKWLLAHAEAACVALVPRSLAPNETRSAACAALRAIDTGGKGDVVRAVASKYGDKARTAVDAVLEFDPLDDYPAKLAKLPDFAEPTRLPAPRTRSGKALPESAMRALLTMLAFSNPSDPYAGLSQVKEACDAASLAEFAWALFQEWMLAGAQGKTDWALVSLATFGNDDSARLLAPKIREWPGEGGHARAVKGLDVLASIGSDVALMHLDRIAQKLKFKGLQQKARDKMQEVAAARGLSPDELGDRIAPTLDLDEDGSKMLSFGARSFRVGFDADLRPFVKSEDGKRLEDLPKPTKTDDASVAKASVATFKALKKDARAVASSQVLRLERAMCARRTWDAVTFLTFLVAHPLVSHLVRRLVWGVDRDGKMAATFRVAEDRSLADDRDQAFALADDAVVLLAHPLELGDDTISRWSAVFGDYEIVQPFPQLARETFAIDANEKSKSEIHRFKGKKVATGRVLGLEDRGWSRGVPQDAGWIWDMVKRVSPELSAAIEIGGGILAGDFKESPPEQELGALELYPAVRGDKNSATFGSLDAVTFSELMRDLSLLTKP